METAEARQIAEEAYVYGLQQVVFYETRFTVTQLEGAPVYAGVNRLDFNPRPSGPADRLVVTPNATTLYGAGFLDLSEEPVVVDLPAIEDRYFSLQVMDQYGDFYFYAGNQFTGRQSQTFILVGPSTSATVPAEFAGTDIIAAPSSSAFVLVRIALHSYAEDDVATVNAYQQQIMVTPLDQWLENGHRGVPAAQRTPVKGTYPVFSRMPLLAQALVEVQTAMDYFQLLGLVLNDPTMTKREDSLKETQTLARLAEIGLAEGTRFDPAALHHATRQALEDGFDRGKQKVKEAVRQGMLPMNGWMVTKDMGNFGTDYLNRAAIADAGWGGPESKSHIGGFCFVDADGQQLNGSNRYTLRFDTEDLPPCTEFWSIPIYDIEGYFIDNPIDRYTVNSFMYERGEFHIDADGGLTFHLQHQQPADPDAARNWLPAPEGDFRLVARFYGPKAALIDGSYPMPRAQRVP